MGQLEVLFHVPQFIEYGLASGQFERVGGVIVESGSRRIVAWLRDGGVVEAAATAAGAGNPLGTIIQASSTAANLMDGRMTQQALNVATRQMQTMGKLTVSGQLLNLAFSAMTFQIIIRRLDALAQQIETLSEVVRAEFDRERDMRFKISLQAARDLFESDSPLTRQEASRTAIDGLYEARENFLIDFYKSIEHENSLEYNQMAHHYLLRAIYAEISRVRCYAASGDIELAKIRLSESMPIFREYTETLIRNWIGQHPAVYFHENVSSEMLARFLRVQQWLRNKHTGNDPTIIFSIIDDLRRDFWNDELIQDKYNTLLNKVTRRPTLTMDNRVERLSANLEQAEIVMENFDRLRGLELEMRSMRLSLKEWSNLVSREKLEEHGMALIVEKERLMQAF